MVDTLVGSLNVVATRWSVWMLDMFWQVALLVGIVWLAARVSRKSSASFRYTLWLLVFVKLLLPPTLAAPWSAGNFAAKFFEIPRTSTVQDVLPVSPGRDLQEPVIGIWGVESTESVSRAAPMAATLAVPVKPRRPMTPLTLLMCGWAAVAAVSFTALLVQYRRYSRRILGKLSPATEPVQEMFSKQMKVLNIRREVRLEVSSDVHTPAVFGFWRPVILLPEGEHERFSREELSNVLAHELAHIKRKDMLLTFVAGLLSCLYWFHPAVWLANLNLRREREMACDDVVLESTRQEAKQYARTILHVAESFEGGVPAGAGFLGLLELSDNLLHRIRSVADAKRARRFGWNSAVAIALLTAACVPMARWSERAAVPEHPNTANVDDEINIHYSKADPEVQEYVRWTAGTFGRPGVNLWLPENAFDSLTAEERKAKVDYHAQVLEGDYGRHLCRAVVEAGVLRDRSLLPGVLRVATYHRDDSDYDCRPKWMAVAAVGRFGDESVVPELVNLVDHGNKNTRMWARASLVRLTGRNFNDDKQAWANWWNRGGKQPPIEPAALQPWRLPGKKPEQPVTRAPAQAEETRQRYLCADNLKRLGLAFEMYAKEWHGRFPPIDGRRGNLTMDGNAVFPAHLTDLNVLRCAGNAEHEPIRGPGIAAAVTDQSYFYLGWMLSTEEEGLVLLRAYGSRDLEKRDQDIDVGQVQTIAGPSSWIYRIREGMERFYITDVMDPQATMIIRSQVPVMWGRPANHGDTGANVLFMDGHVEFVQYPGKFPMTEKFMTGLLEVSAKKEAGAEAADPTTLATAAAQTAPEIVSVSPPIGATGVDPATKEIRVTFDQDMGGGFSWTGGGPMFPKGTGRPQWVEKRTCVMPVALEPAKFYRVGINSKSHKNFSGVNGVPARVRVIYFATEGADESVLRALKAPAVVSMTPENGATDVPSTLTEMSVTFDQPMVGGFSWTGGGDQFPEGTGRPQWSADKMTCSRPIKLKPNWSYRLGLNSPSHINFQSANGVPLEPVVWRFSTGE